MRHHLTQSRLQPNPAASDARGGVVGDNLHQRPQLRPGNAQGVDLSWVPCLSLSLGEQRDRARPGEDMRTIVLQRSRESPAFR
jgi:hypothetical protein